MVVGKEQYVYRTVKAKCSCGSKDFKQYLNLKKDHGIIFNDSDYPLMNANDHIYEDNINTFGRCKSIFNPNSYGMGGLLGGSLGPLGVLLGAATIGCPCKPLTPFPWIDVDSDYFIDGAPALTNRSVLPCAYGGEITIEMETQESETTEGKPEEKPEEIDKKALLPSEVQEKIDSFTDDAPSSLQKTGSMELAMGDQVITSSQSFQEMLEVPQMFERYGTYIAEIQINDTYTE